MLFSKKWLRNYPQFLLLGHDIQSDTLVRSCLDSVAAVHNVYSSMLVILSTKEMK